MDATHYNGGPDDGHARTIGRRRDPETVEDLRGTACDRCGLPMHRIYTLADVGAFCSPRCRSLATTTTHRATA